MGQCLSLAKPLEVVLLSEIQETLINEIKQELRDVIIPNLIVQLNMTEANLEEKIN